jgi:hypothetical protein
MWQDRMEISSQRSLFIDGQRLGGARTGHAPPKTGSRKITHYVAKKKIRMIRMDKI